MVLVRKTVITDWQALRDIRLLALRDAPVAFSSTYARESALSEAEWQQQASRDGSFIAFLPEVSPAGLAGGYPTPERQPLPSNPSLSELGMTCPL